MKPLEIIAKDDSNRFLYFFIRLGESKSNEDADEDAEVASEFVCRIYGQNDTNDINEARYKKLLQMSGNVNQVILGLL